MDNKQDKAKDSVITEIKLSVNRRLYEKGCITEDMYRRAKDLIIKQSA